MLMMLMLPNQHANVQIFMTTESVEVKCTETMSLEYRIFYFKAHYLHSGVFHNNGHFLRQTVFVQYCSDILHLEFMIYASI